MKRYINCYLNGSAVMYPSAKLAKAHYGPDDAYAVAVEVNLPDPPHVWAVGDWFTQPSMDAAYPRRIVDMSGQRFACTWRGEYEAVTADWYFTVDLKGATPCDPPAWFTDGGAS